MPGTPAPDYAELHCISNFSFLRGASHPEELVNRAHELGYTALALTDECSLPGIVRAHLAARKVGLPLIAGSEFRLDHAQHLVLLATNRVSYGNLSALISLARRQAAKGEYRLQLDELSAYTQDCLLIWVNAEQCDSRQDTATWIQNHFTKRAWLGVTRQLDGKDRQRLQTLQCWGSSLICHWSPVAEPPCTHAAAASCGIYSRPFAWVYTSATPALPCMPMADTAYAAAAA